MTNTEIIQAIRNEIERRIKECEATYPKDKGGYWFPEQEEAYAIAEEYKQLLSFLGTLESGKTISPWMRNHTYTEELHEGDMEKMLLELSVGKGEKRTKTALPDRIVDILESEKPIGLEEEIHKYNKERFDEYFPEQDGDFISEVDFMTCLDRVARHFARWGAEHRGSSEIPADLEEAAQQYAEGPECTWVGTTALEYAFIAGAKWQKDALLEWAKQKQYESLTIVADNFWQEVIDKLNSL